MTRRKKNKKSENILEVNKQQEYIGLTSTANTFSISRRQKKKKNKADGELFLFFFLLSNLLSSTVPMSFKSNIIQATYKKQIVGENENEKKKNYANTNQINRSNLSSFLMIRVFILTVQVLDAKIVQRLCSFLSHDFFFF